MQHARKTLCVSAFLLLIGAGCAAPAPPSPSVAAPSCDSLAAIPSVDVAPENVRARFVECFPDRNGQAPAPAVVPAASANANVPPPAGPDCGQLQAIPSSQYAPADVRDAFKRCFPERG